MKIGVVVPLISQTGGQVQRFSAIRAFARQAEDAGLDSIWVFDHLLLGGGEVRNGIWEAWTMLAALAAATERVELGTLVMCVPFRNPAVLAKMASTLDEVSEGRLILGLGAGWHKPEFDSFGAPFDHKADRFEEALQIIVPLLREGRVSFQGRYYQAENCELLPRGPRPAGPPILVGAAKPRMLRLTARYADAWNTCWLGLPTTLAERRATLEAACAAEGRDPRTLDVTVGVSVSYPAADAPPEQRSNSDTALAGSPEEIAAGLRAYEEQGAAHLICRLAPANADSLARFAEALRLYRG